MARRHTPWTDDGPVISTPVTRRSGKTKTVAGESTESVLAGFADDPIALVTIITSKGKIQHVTPAELMSSPAIKALSNPRGVQRFWRLNVPISGTLEYRTDEGMVKFAAMAGYRVTDPVVAGKAMNHIAEWYEIEEVTEDGKKKTRPKIGFDGDWIRTASPYGDDADGSTP